MSRTLRVLIVEDQERDALLLVRELKRNGYDVVYERVDTEELMKAALDEKSWDVVLSDYSMPRFSAPAALAVIKAREVDLPFIIVSGTVSEDIAVAALHAGAHDFMGKGKLGRLVTSIERERANVISRADQRKMRDQLMISDRMASMGTLAAGVAHEINNPLACVMANLDLALDDIAIVADRLSAADQFGEIREELVDARAAVDRIRDIVKDLKIFSRSVEDKTGPVDVHRVLDSTLRMAHNEVRHRARLVRSYGAFVPVEASESRLGQVFLNLVMNAAHAIREGDAENNEIRVTTQATESGDMLVEVRDTGSGMPPDVLEKLFTPFFTTKPTGLGTGLGLSICKRIVTALGGTIEVESTVGQGTCFRVTLPRAKDDLRDDGPPISRNLRAKRRARILVVDDEPMVTRLVQRALTPEHDVTALNSVEEVLRLIDSGSRFDVILSDLMMPQMTGMDLHDELTRRAPDQAARTIFLTGGAFTERARTFLDATPCLRIEKPFGAQELRALINDQVQ